MGCNSSGTARKAETAKYEENVECTLEGSGSCTIPDAHMRGITLRQLHTLHEFANWRCQIEQWFGEESCGTEIPRTDSIDSQGVSSWSRRLTAMKRISSKQSSVSPSAQSFAPPEAMNLYHLVDNLIKPITEPRACSYVEYCAIDERNQVPEWFISHSWGGSVHSFIKCLAHFNQRHNLDDQRPYWICAYALRQNQIKSEISIRDNDDIRQAPFAEALLSPTVNGMIVILDESLHVFRRAWCCFEAALAIGNKMRIDILTSQARNGCTNAYLLPGDGADMPVIAEEAFPLKVAEAGLNVAIELSVASDMEDLNRILNFIALGIPGSENPKIKHPNYDVVNRRIIGMFATVVLRIAVANGDVDAVRRALHADKGLQAHRTWRNAQNQTQLEIAEALARSNPNDGARVAIVEYLQQQEIAYLKQSLEGRSDRPEGLFQRRDHGSCSTLQVKKRKNNSQVGDSSPRGGVGGGELPPNSDPASQRCSKTSACSDGSSLMVGQTKSAKSCTSYTHSNRSTSPRVSWVSRMFRTSRGEANVTSKAFDTARVVPGRVSFDIPEALGRVATPPSPIRSSKSRHSTKTVDSIEQIRRSLLDEVPPLPLSNRAENQEESLSPRTSPRTIAMESTWVPASDVALEHECPLLSAREEVERLVSDHFTATSKHGKATDHLVATLFKLQACLWNPAIQEDACNELGRLVAREGGRFQELAVKAGAAEALVVTMRAHVGNAGVQRQACRALRCLIEDCLANVKPLIEAEVWAVVLSAREAHPEDTTVQQEVELTLHDLSVGQNSLEVSQ